MREDSGRNATGHWKRSSKCNSGNCVEVMVTSEDVRMRDSSRGDEVLAFSRPAWAAFVAEMRSLAVKEGEEITIRSAGAEAFVGYGDGGRSLSFARSHWDVFIKGVRAGEFDL
ncbi:hypothetical protein GCM10022223_03330 [Kineosporia mesophila]|uniref:DUF397 domain-containing protein n=1 Tax=Kineosporia mesophila TaxID=566012 RepID=A0ABP6YV29_9ACTN|nr:DUF397 domain-containing protein [Kineosporia mesophila]MCD5351817.1 DUF397 domain-containing protein [Kineosporia mesophila]